MEQKDFKKMLELMGKMFELKKDMQDVCKAQGIDLDSDDSDNNESDKDVSDDNENDREIAESLQNEYETMMKWAFGNNFQSDSKLKSIKKWLQLHPTLPIPRALTSNLIKDDMVTLCGLFDIIHLYHAHMKANK